MLDGHPALQELDLIPDRTDVGLRYVVLRNLKTRGEFVSVEVEVTDKDLTDLRQKLSRIWQAIDTGVIYRVKSWTCQNCPWGWACREVDLGGV